jgi:hypothetical protein
MNDIVERLRERAKFAREERTGTADGDYFAFTEAANEIERLRGELGRLISTTDSRNMEHEDDNHRA